MKIERLLGILFYIINRDNVSANNLAEHFNVSRRTIIRDIDTLTLAGIPIYSEIGAICGATLALANLKVLDKFKHTSNSLDYLTLFSKQYSEKGLYVNSPAFVDCNLITASSAGGLLWAKHIIQYLNAFPCEIIESWYNYYSTCDPKYYTELISQGI